MKVLKKILRYSISNKRNGSGNVYSNTSYESKCISMTERSIYGAIYGTYANYLLNIKENKCNNETISPHRYTHNTM